MNELDLSPETIKELFYRQIRALTMRSTVGTIRSCELARLKTFELQFSGAWLEA